MNVVRTGKILPGYSWNGYGGVACESRDDHDDHDADKDCQVASEAMRHRFSSCHEKTKQIKSTVACKKRPLRSSETNKLQPGMDLRLLSIPDDDEATAAEHSSERDREKPKQQTPRVQQHEYHDYMHDQPHCSSLDSQEECPALAPSEEWERRPAGSPVPNFTIKLHEMLTAAVVEGFEHLVSWQPHGRAFVIHDQECFHAEILPRFFGVKLSSFKRQINMYGFKRIFRRGPDYSGFYHEKFLRGRVFLAHSIQRVRVKGEGARKKSNPEAEPNFYAMPWLEELPHSNKACRKHFTQRVGASLALAPKSVPFPFCAIYGGGGGGGGNSAPLFTTTHFAAKMTFRPNETLSNGNFHVFPTPPSGPSQGMTLANPSLASSPINVPCGDPNHGKKKSSRQIPAFRNGTSSSLVPIFPNHVVPSHHHHKQQEQEQHWHHSVLLLPSNAVDAAEWDPLWELAQVVESQVWAPLIEKAAGVVPAQHHSKSRPYQRRKEGYQDDDCSDTVEPLTTVSSVPRQNHPLQDTDEPAAAGAGAAAADDDDDVEPIKVVLGEKDEDDQPLLEEMRFILTECLLSDKVRDSSCHGCFF